jgi:hypothetical protein
MESRLCMCVYTYIHTCVCVCVCVCEMQDLGDKLRGRGKENDGGE